MNLMPMRGSVLKIKFIPSIGATVGPKSQFPFIANNDNNFRRVQPTIYFWAPNCDGLTFWNTLNVTPVIHKFYFPHARHPPLRTSCV